jgi:hypothetical protein
MVLRIRSPRGSMLLRTNTLTLVDIVMNSRAIQGILKSLGLPTEPALAHPSRAPPDHDLDSA